MIRASTVVCLGFSQLICWGTSFYLIGVLSEYVMAEFAWDRALAYGGFSGALVVMGLSSPLTGRLIDRFGGRTVMTVGSCLIAGGFGLMALSHGAPAYYAAWICIGLGMRFSLYDAAFATLARIGGPAARRSMSQITLFGGLASSVFWPIGHTLAEHLGWRGTLVAYAGFALLTIPLHLAIPAGRYRPADDGHHSRSAPLATSARDRRVAGVLYAGLVTVTNGLTAGISAHVIGIMSDLGMAASLSVWVASLIGVGQSSARLCEVLFGARLHPLDLNLLAIGAMPFCFAAGLLSGHSANVAIGFVFAYGAANGILSISRGTLPLVLFDHRTYGLTVGRLLVPSFLLSAVAPLGYALVIDAYGSTAALYLSIVLASLAVIASVVLKLRFDPRRIHGE